MSKVENLDDLIGHDPKEAEAFFRTLGGVIFVADRAEKVREIIKSHRLLGT